MSSRDMAPQEWQQGSSFQESSPSWETPSSGTSSGQSMMDRTKEAASTAQEQAGQMVDQATTKVDEGMDKAASGLDRAADSLRQRSETMSEGTASDMATMAADRIEQGAQFLREKDTDQLMTDLENLVRRKPVESLLVAAGIGFVLSKALR